MGFALGTLLTRETREWKLTFTGSAQKGMFGKGSLEGAGKKNGKGLTIYVQTKKDAKQMKKQLKKAGIPGAKVKVEK